MSLFADPFALLGALLVAVGFAGLVGGADLVRRLIGFNVAGSGLFLMFGGLSGRMLGAPLPTGPDPVPQAMVITGIVVALAAIAIGIALARGLETVAPPDE